MKPANGAPKTGVDDLVRRHRQIMNLCNLIEHACENSRAFRTGQPTAENLRGVRRALGMTQAQFADEIGLSKGFIGEMERGEKEVAKITYCAAHALFFQPAKIALEEIRNG